jgi:HSP20 family protein
MPRWVLVGALRAPFRTTPCEEVDMTLSNFDPLFDRMLSRMQSGFAGAATQMAPPMDVYRRGDDFVVELDVPGIDPSDIDITVERSMLTVAGEIDPRHDQAADEVLVCERPHARFRRQVYLGESLDTEKIRADFDNGVLRITIPASRELQSRRIEVQGGQRDTAPGESGSGPSIDVEGREQQSQQGSGSAEDRSNQSGESSSTA